MRAGRVCQSGRVLGFDELVSEALTAPFSGWDFSWLAARSTEGTLPWSYRREVARRAVAAGTMLDLGTGGGERLSRLSPPQPGSWLPLARRQVEDAGLAVETAVCGEQRLEFHDVAAVVYYLRVVGFAIPHYSLDACAASLRAAHDTPQMWPVAVRQRRFLLIATKPR
jgi:hypothetical protein